MLQRRLLLGIGLTVALGAFALVPTDSLRIGRPSKPLFLYLVPLLRIQVTLSCDWPPGTVCARHQTCDCDVCTVDCQLNVHCVSQALLSDVREIVADGKWDELEPALQRIQGSPNNSTQNLRDAAHSKPSCALARTQFAVI